MIRTDPLHYLALMKLQHETFSIKMIIIIKKHVGVHRRHKACMRAR
jgi:hypothetical protein